MKAEKWCRNEKSNTGSCRLAGAFVEALLGVRPKDHHHQYVPHLGACENHGPTRSTGDHGGRTCSSGHSPVTGLHVEAEKHRSGLRWAAARSLKKERGRKLEQQEALRCWSMVAMGTAQLCLQPNCSNYVYLFSGRLGTVREICMRRPAVPGSWAQVRACYLIKLSW